jgi:hypothetical protein
MNGGWAARLLLAVSAALMLVPSTMAEIGTRTAGEFLALCDRLDPGCRAEFVAGLQAVYAGGLACPPRIDANTPIAPWLDDMRRLVRQDAGLAGVDKNRLQLTAFEDLWPCPKRR